MSQDNVSYWSDLWSGAKTQWHLSKLNPALQKHGDSFFGQDTTSILFPLCGKSLDMAILAGKYKVTGIEGVQQAFDELAVENNSELIKVETCVENFDKFQLKVAKEGETHEGLETRNSPIIDLYLGDFFAMKPDNNAQYDRVFDRGSLVAILPQMREAYMKVINSLLKKGGKWMVASMCYDQALMPGPPHSIGPDDIRVLLEQLEKNVPGTKYMYEVVEKVHGVDMPMRSRFLKENGGPLDDFQDYVIVITKVE